MNLEWNETDSGWEAETPAGIHLLLTIEPDDVPVEGNAMASGDDAADKAYELEILRRLGDGDCWAWASVAVRADYKSLEGSAYLGCCSYGGFKDFAVEDGYLPSLVSEAIDELLASATTAEQDIAELRSKLVPEGVTG